jgi:elongation factor G
MPAPFTTDRIRNVVVVGHGGSGKTTLIDACAAASGTIRRHGSVDDGTALTMFTPEEIAHGISTQVSVGHAVWMETKINLIDTPGYQDFAGETAAGVRVADAALLVVSAQDGVEVGTERVWAMLEERHLPTIVFITGMDRPNADFEAVFRDVRDHLVPNAIPVEIPIGAGEDFRGIVNLFSERAHLYREGTDRGEYEEADVPEEMREMESAYYQELIETIAATDDELLEHYLEGEEITREEAIHGLKQAMLDGSLVPVFCGAPTRTWGVRALLNKVVELFPSPAERPAQTAEGRRVPVEMRSQNTDPFCALVFKTTSEPHVGELSYFRIFGGSVATGAEVMNVQRDSRERLAHLSVPQGKERVGGGDAARRGHRRGGQASRHPHQRHPLVGGAPAHPRHPHPHPRARRGGGRRVHLARRRGEAGGGAPQAARGGSGLRRRVRARAAPDHRPWPR